MAAPVKVNESLKVKIAETKELLCKGRDTYCTINLDQEEIFRTSIADRNTDCSYVSSEEFCCEIPKQFRRLCFYVYICERERTTSKPDKVLGKVAIKREELNKYHGLEQWFTLSPVDEDSEVKGKVHLQLRLLRCSGSNNKIGVKLVECNDLPIISGACHPYAIISLYKDGQKCETQKTKVKKNSNNPNYSQQIFTFDIPAKSRSDGRDTTSVESCLEKLEIRLTMQHDIDNVFMGEVRIPLDRLNLNLGHEAWYFLKSRNESHSSPSRGFGGYSSGDGSGVSTSSIMTGSSGGGSIGAATSLSSVNTHHRHNHLGSIRLNIKYTVDHVFPTSYYEPLQQLLLRSATSSHFTSSAVCVLGEIASDQWEVAKSVVRVFVEHKQFVPLIKNLAYYEMETTNDAFSVFRSNSLVALCMTEYMKLVGLHYLHDTLKYIIDKIFHEKKTCEIGPSRVNPEDLETNIMNLRGYVEDIFESIMNSALTCPTEMCNVLYELKEAAMSRFPSQSMIKYLAVSNFVFLRFFALAILSPNNYELTTTVPDLIVYRTLTLISKTIQSLGNSVTASPNTHGQARKEDYMIPIYKSFYDDEHMSQIRTYLDILSSVPGSHYAREIEAPIVLKEGTLKKRAQGRRRWGRKNFKSRYFVLTTQALSYSKKKGDRALCSVPITDIKAVEPLEEKSFKKEYMFQVQHERPLYVQATNCVSCKEWTELLNKVSQTNRDRLKHYHPATYANNHWLCCKKSSSDAEGCKPVTGIPANIHINIDLDRQMERIHSIFYINRDKMERLLAECKQGLTQGTPTSSPLPSPTSLQPPPPPITITHRKSRLETLIDLQRCVAALETEHKKYIEQHCNHIKYGSKQAPIGDDNYLILMSSVTR